jgi:hypothetical protein
MLANIKGFCCKVELTRSWSIKRAIQPYFMLYKEGNYELMQEIPRGRVDKQSWRNSKDKLSQNLQSHS